jgi:hypothetical protein
LYFDLTERHDNKENQIKTSCDLEKKTVLGIISNYRYTKLTDSGNVMSKEM